MPLFWQSLSEPRHEKTQTFLPTTAQIYLKGLLIGNKLHRHFLFLSQGPVLIAPSLAESPHQHLPHSIATERATEILRFSLS